MSAVGKDDFRADVAAILDRWYVDANEEPSPEELKALRESLHAHLDCAMVFVQQRAWMVKSRLLARGAR